MLLQLVIQVLPLDQEEIPKLVIQPLLVPVVILLHPQSIVPQPQAPSDVLLPLVESLR
jgi:hypothetical protein